MPRLIKKISFKGLFFLLIVACIALYVFSLLKEKEILNKIIERLSADSRVAEVIVTDVKFDADKGKNLTTIKFLEYDTNSKPLQPRYFTFSDNIIQFQALVIRFDDFYVKKAHPLKGKSAYIFMKAFTLKDKETEVYEINQVNSVPTGYIVEGAKNIFEIRLWQRFWDYALSPEHSKRVGIKNAQIEAPGTKFIPNFIYTIKIEHDAGLRIDSQPIPSILKGEAVK